ncbi:MAG: D-alanyl-D-alanine carboxypeptidase family protein, partial [Streptosporangiaceae bacterium]
MTGRFVALVAAGALTVAVFMPASTARASSPAGLASSPAGLASSPAGLASSPARTTQARVTSWPTGVRAAEAAIADVRTGKILWSRELNTERPMASITKVMTAYLVIRAGHLDRAITIPAAVTGYVRAHNASNAGLRPGDKLTPRQLLYALMLPSGADAAYALAKAYGPGIPAFVAKMNATARLLGMTRTHFSNFDG